MWNASTRKLYPETERHWQGVVVAGTAASSEGTSRASRCGSLLNEKKKRIQTRMKKKRRIAETSKLFQCAGMNEGNERPTPANKERCQVGMVQL